MSAMRFVIVLASCLTLLFGTHLPNARLDVSQHNVQHPVYLRAGHATHISRVRLPHTPSAHVQSATITVTYNGFPTEAQAAFQAAVDIWQAQISSPIAITVQANWTQLPSTVLGSASPNNYFRLNNNTIYPVALANKLVGTDLDPSSEDIVANFNSSFAKWYYGTDGNTPLDLYDLESVVLHELGHGLGFIGSMDVNTSTGQGQWGDNGYPFIFDRFAVNGSNQALINTSVFPNPSKALATQLTSNSVFFNGTQARAAVNTNTVQLYAPSNWEAGSSYGHLDEEAYPAGDPNSLMTPILHNGESVHTPGAITLGMFTDMGWTTTPQQAPTITTTRTPSATPLPTASSTPTSSPTLAPSHPDDTFVLYLSVVSRD